MDKIKICVLSYNHLYYLVEEAIKLLDDDELDVFTLSCRHESLYECVQTAIGMGAEAFVAGASNYKIFQQYYDYPVVEIVHSLSDYIRCISEVADYCKSISVITYFKTPVHDFSVLEKIFNIKISLLTYNDREHLEEQIIQCDSDIIVGASIVCEYAAKFNKKYILIYSKDLVEIVNAMLVAKKIVLEIRHERNNAIFFSTVIDNSPNGIVGIRKDGTIINYNPSAARILGIPALTARGRIITDLFPDFDMAEYINTNEIKRLEKVIVYNNKALHLFIQSIDGNSDNICTIVIMHEKFETSMSGSQYIRYHNKHDIKHNFQTKYTFTSIKGESDAIKKTIEQAKIYADSTSSILITGETGTGKELFAQSIHSYSDRRHQKFVAINCAAIPENLFESEIFGYKEGAFTGSHKGGKIGLLELANYGTIFLDEISELSSKMQIKFLRAIQEKEIMRIGDDKVIPIDIRVIAATNKTTEQMIDDGFRRDLLYRLNVLNLEIPPLRDRGDDCIILFRSLLEKNIDKYKMPIELTDDILSVLKYYSWNGNIRELENVSQRFALFLSQKTKRFNKNDIEKTLCDCISTKKIFNDILKKYNYNKDHLDNLNTKKMIILIKSLLKLSNDQIGEMLDISRTTLWRITK